MTIIMLPVRHPAPHGAEGSTAPEKNLFLPSLAGRRLLAEIEKATMNRVAGCEQAVSLALAHNLLAPALLAGLPWRDGGEGRPAQLDLAQRRSFRIFARRWLPGQFGPLRRMMDWFAYGVAQGRLIELDYAEGQVPAPQKGGDCRSAAAGHSELSAGQLRHGAGGGQGLRRFANLSSEVAVSVHVEGLPHAASAAIPVLMPVPWNEARILRRHRLVLVSGGDSEKAISP